MIGKYHLQPANPQEAYRAALETLPKSKEWMPLFSTIKFLRGGIPLPTEDTNVQEYLKQCEKKGVVPCSDLWVRAADFVYPELRDMPGLPEKLKFKYHFGRKGNRSDTVLKPLILGQRTHSVTYEAVNNSFFGGYTSFVRNFLPLHSEDVLAGGEVKVLDGEGSVLKV